MSSTYTAHIQSLVVLICALGMVSTQVSWAQPTSDSQNSTRSQADLTRDTTSKPEEVLAFINVQPGWQVLDLFAGNGYYSEILARAVGPTGKVYLHNNKAYLPFVNQLDDRLKDNRLPNVTPLQSEIEALGVPSASIDLVMLVLAYHDAYYQTDGWDVTAEPLFAAIHDALKPGGTLIVIDHHARSGSGSNHAQDLHRIDAEFAKQDISGRQFKFEAASAILENDADDLTKSVFDPSIRGKTSRFIYKFSKISP